jgi:membrane-associated phospholipid phosphatase
VKVRKSSPRSSQRAAFAAVLTFACGCCAFAQQGSSSLPDAPQPQAASQETVTLRNTPRNLLHDQVAIWTSPAHIRDSNVLIPVTLVLATTVTITTDHQFMTDIVTYDPSINNDAVTASNGLVGGFIAAPVVFYGLGHIHHDDHATETGILAGEAMLDSLAVSEVIKIISRRERPAVNNAKGEFFQSGVGFDSSFASNHSVIAWSSAAAIATEYPGPLTKLTAYGLATGVSITRVLGREHFPSDVLVGSAVGWLIGRYVVHHHHRTY